MLGFVLQFSVLFTWLCPLIDFWLCYFGFCGLGCLVCFSGCSVFWLASCLSLGVGSREALCPCARYPFNLCFLLKVNKIFF